jgi:hypothetical protein
MKTNVSKTSLAAYHSLPDLAYLQPKEQAIMGLFNTPETRYSRQQIARITGMPINVVCGRVNSLVETRGLLKSYGTRLDPETKKSQELLGLV